LPLTLSLSLGGEGIGKGFEILLKLRHSLSILNSGFEKPYGTKDFRRDKKALQT
jgi:hypothetical protein